MLINNQDHLLINEISTRIEETTEVLICTTFFTFNALYDLIEYFNKAKTVKILIDQSYWESNKVDYANLSRSRSMVLFSL